MKRTNRGYIFVILLALLFWNPLSFFLIYGESRIYNNKIISISFWISFLIALLLIFLISKKKLSSTVYKTIFSLAFAGIFFSFLVYIDGAIGLVFPNEKAQNKNLQGLIFEPNSRVRYKTTEFDYTAEINSLGLRDIEMSIDKKKKYRILCFGDSYTYGWGVNIEFTWPKKLETILRRKGVDVEVINCGQPGQYTTGYKQHMEKAVPLLKPDLVLVGVLQLDDLSQLYEYRYYSELKKSSDAAKKKSSGNILQAYKEFLSISFENSLHLIKNDDVKEAVIQENWEASTKERIANFNILQKINYHTFDDSVRILFETGNLNPALLWYYIDFPERELVFNNPSNKATLFAIQEMKKDLEAMKTICKKSGSQLIFINLPAISFVNHEVIRAPSFNYLHNYFTENNKIDSIYRSIALQLNIPYYELTERFLKLPKTSYFFRFDGHPNEKGYEEIANGVGEFLTTYFFK